MEHDPNSFSLNPPTPDAWPEYYVFAHEFDGYAAFPGTLYEIADEVMRNWYEKGTLPDDLTLLRSSLFREARSSRFITGYPGESDMAYLDALVTKIKTLMAISPTATETLRDLPNL